MPPIHTLTDFETRLRTAGLRVTAARTAVLAEVVVHPHADVDTIARAVRAKHRSVSTQAVYDALRAFAARDLVRRIEPPGSPARYEARVGDNHHHIVCRICGAIEDVDCAAGSAPCLDPVSDRGFVVDEAEVTFWGYCPACARSRRTSTQPPDPATKEIA